MEGLDKVATMHNPTTIKFRNVYDCVGELSESTKNGRLATNKNKTIMAPVP
jgi:hypothetical protein